MSTALQNELLLAACRHARRECADDLPDAWEKLVLHVDIGDGYKRCWGHAFDSEGKFYATSGDSDTLATFAQLRQAMAEEQGRAWLLCQVVIAPNGAFDITFEYDDRTRWQATPDNWMERITQCRALPVPTTQHTFAPISRETQHKMLIALCQSAVIECGARLPDVWEKLVLCGEYDGHSAGMFGYAFDPEGRHYACAPRGNTLSRLQDLYHAMAQTEQRPWVALQIVIAATGFFAVDFEYDHPQRWAVTPANLHARIAEFAALPVPQAPILQ